MRVTVAGELEEAERRRLERVLAEVAEGLRQIRATSRHGEVRVSVRDETVQVVSSVSRIIARGSA